MVQKVCALLQRFVWWVYYSPPYRNLAFIPVVLMGLGILAISYLLACCFRASATITEASQLYIDKNVEEINEDQ